MGRLLSAAREIDSHPTWFTCRVEPSSGLYQRTPGINGKKVSMNLDNLKKEAKRYPMNRLCVMFTTPSPSSTASLVGPN